MDGCNELFFICVAEFWIERAACSYHVLIGQLNTLPIRTNHNKNNDNNSFSIISYQYYVTNVNKLWKETYPRKHRIVVRIKLVTTQ